MSDSASPMSEVATVPTKGRGFPLASELDPSREGPMFSSRGRSWHVRCRYIKKNGERCRSWAMRGSVVCSTPQHGGRLPSVRKKAAERLAHMADMSVEQFQYAVLPFAAREHQLRAALATIRMLGLTSKGIERSLREDGTEKVDDFIDKLKEGKAA